LVFSKRSTSNAKSGPTTGRKLTTSDPPIMAKAKMAVSPSCIAFRTIRKRGISFSYFFTPFSTFSLLFSLFPFEKVMKKEEKVHQKCPFSPYSK
jgi:hypothetical protein